MASVLWKYATEVFAAAKSAAVTQARTGAASTGGAKTAAVTQARTGTTSETGDQRRAVTQARTGSTTPAGTFSRLGEIARSLAGTVSATGQRFLAVGMAQTGTATTSGSTVSRSVAKLVSLALSIIGTIGKAATRPLSGTTTPAGSIVVRLVIWTGDTFRRALWSLPRTWARTGQTFFRLFRRGVATMNRVWTRDRNTTGRTFERDRGTISRTWGLNMSNAITPIELTKTVSDDRFFLFDFSKVPELAAGTAITISSGEVTGGSGLTFGSVTVTAAILDGIAAGKATICRISGGADDTTYNFAMKITLSNASVVVMPCALAVTADYE